MTCCAFYGRLIDALFIENEDRLVVMSTDSEWQVKSERCLKDEPLQSFTPELHGKRPVSNCTDEEHENIVKTVQESIVDGQLYQLNYGRLEGEIVTELPCFFTFCCIKSAPYQAFCTWRMKGSYCFSITRILAFNRRCDYNGPNQGDCAKRSIRGRGITVTRRMISDQKERAEHRMLVDLMRNDVGQIAYPNQSG